MPEAAAAPTPRPVIHGVERDIPNDGNADKFRTLVVGTDGTLKYEYFSPEPATRVAEHDKAADRGSGFYAMVPGPDGTLRYKFFPSKPSP